jgi:transposase-like protein
LIDDLVREGARRMLAEALQAEVDDYIARFAGERDENGRRLVVRNGSHQPREVLTSAGAVEVTAPRVNDRRTDADTGQRARFSSAILPPWCRKTPKITEVLPLLYLHGLSTGDFVPALGQFLGSSAGLSAPGITKLTEAWKAEQRAFAARDLSGVTRPRPSGTGWPATPASTCISPRPAHPGSTRSNAGSGCSPTN